MSTVHPFSVRVPVAPGAVGHQSFPDPDLLLGHLKHIQVLCNMQRTCVCTKDWVQGDT